MSRPITHELNVEFELEAVTPLHVGGAARAFVADLPLLVDGMDRVIVPGTSLAGVLRGWLAEVLDNTEMEEWWGRIPPKSTEKTDDSLRGHASLFSIEDAVLIRSGEPLSPAECAVRHSVALDRDSGTAANKKLFTRQVIPRGTHIPVVLTIEIPASEDPTKLNRARRFVGALLTAFANDEIGVGSGTTRGMGRVRLASEPATDGEADMKPTVLGRYRVRDFTSRSGFLDSLTDDAWRPVAELIADGEGFGGKPQLVVVIDWHPNGPLMTKAAGDGLAVDALPEVALDNDHAYLVLAGASVKGALRSEAERIVRSVIGTRFGDTDAADSSMVELVGELFGAAMLHPKGASGRRDPDADAAAESEASARIRGRGAVGVNDSFSISRINATRWRAFVSAAAPAEAGKTADGDNEREFTNQELRDAIVAIRDNDNIDLDVGFHVGLDRVTGGASDSLLFTSTEPWSIEWEPLRLRIDLSREDLEPAAVHLLLLALDRLAQGAVPLGYGTNRGYGDVKVDGIDISGRNLGDSLLKGLVTNGRVHLGDIDVAVTKQAWDDWVSRNRTEVPA